MRLELQATPEEVMRAVEAVQEFGRKKQLDERQIFGLALALEECACNIVEHAYHREAQQKFQVIVEHTGQAVCIELRDRGPEFDPTQERAAKAATNEEDRPPGGWGVSLVRHYMDEIRYRREGGENILRLTKRLDQAPGEPPSVTETKNQ